MSAAMEARSQAASRPGFDRHWLVAGVAVLLLVPLLWPSFSSMQQQWETSTYSYGYLIAPVSLYLLWHDRERLLPLRLRSAVLPVLLAVPVAIGWVVAVLLKIDVVHQAAAVALVILVVWSIVGTQAFRLAIYPLAYLFLMVPVGDQLIPYLMQLTADVTVKAVQASGVPVYQDGYVFSLPSGNFEIVEACSGVRFLMAAVAAGAAFAYIAFNSAWKRLLFVVASMVVGILGNQLRAYLVVMIAHLTDLEYGRDHETFGTILNAGILLAFFAVAARYADRDAPGAGDSSGVVAPGQGLAGRYGPALAVVIVAAVAGVMPDVLAARAAASVAGGASATRMPVPGWVAVVAPADEQAWQPEFAEPLEVVAGRYRPLTTAGTPEPVDLRRARFAAVGSNADLTSSTNRMLAEPWSLFAAGVSGPAGSQRRDAVIRTPDGRQRLVWWWYRVGDRWTTSPVEAEWLTLRFLLTGDVPIRELVAVSTTFAGYPADAEPTLEAFSRAAGLPVAPGR